MEYVVRGFMEPSIPRDRKKRSDAPEPTLRGRIPQDMSLVDRMLCKLTTKAGKASYSKRKGIVEPVLGQIKQVRVIRAFLLRGLEKVKGE
ncbi:MAG: transposase [Thermodesulfobacteriota bacterium]